MSDSRRVSQKIESILETDKYNIGYDTTRRCESLNASQYLLDLGQDEYWGCTGKLEFQYIDVEFIKDEGPEGWEVTSVDSAGAAEGTVLAAAESAMAVDQPAEPQEVAAMETEAATSTEVQPAGESTTSVAMAVDSAVTQESMPAEEDSDDDKAADSPMVYPEHVGPARMTISHHRLHISVGVLEQTLQVSS